MMSAGARKFALTVHVVTSVGFPGAVACFLALAIVGLTSADPQVIRGVYLAMDLIAWFVIVPLSFASPLTGLVSSLGTYWGLFRYYWVVLKILITIPSTVILLIHMRPISYMARVTAESTAVGTDLGKVQVQLVVASAAALLVLLVATVLSVYKPRGMTKYGWRKQNEQRVGS